MISIAAPLISSRPTVPPSESSLSPPQAAAFPTQFDIAQPAGPVVADIAQPAGPVVADIAQRAGPVVADITPPLSEAVLAALSQGAYVAA